MFIGQKKIGRAPIKDGRATVYYEDDSVEEMSEKMFAVSQTEEPLDATGLRDKQMKAVAGDILKVLFDWDIEPSNYEFLDSLVIMSLQEHIKAGEEKLWGKPKNKVRMSEINKVKLS